MRVLLAWEATLGGDFDHRGVSSKGKALNLLGLHFSNRTKRYRRSLLHNVTDSEHRYVSNKLRLLRSTVQSSTIRQ